VEVERMCDGQTCRRVVKLGEPQPPAPLPEQVMYKPFFDLVAPKDNWKNPIDCKIDAPQGEADRWLFKLMITKAVTFYAGSLATITDDGKQIVVKARGYYADVGA
jgi:hypothetical protein